MQIATHRILSLIRALSNENVDQLKFMAAP